ncbi:hypothetical protein BASA81_008029 [Batrachochytrium salamandrivorans]|nr:hypothetical protein BASA81_008029 [Batrachochytrium salamandrivorans]
MQKRYFSQRGEYFESKFGGAIQAEGIRRANLRSISIFSAFAGLHLLFHSSLVETPLKLSTLPGLIAEPGSLPNQLAQVAVSPAWNFLGMAAGVVLWYANAKFARSLVSHVAILPSGLVKTKAHEFYGKPSATESVHFLKDFSREVGDSNSLVYNIGARKFIFDRRDKRMEQIFARAGLTKR